MRVSVLATVVTIGAWLSVVSIAESAIPDLLVGSSESDSILRYDGATGAFLGEFASGGGLDKPLGFDFGPDGDFYVSGHLSNTFLHYDGVTGQFIDATPIQIPHGLTFGSEGNLYVTNYDGTDSFVNRYDVTTGTLLDSFNLVGSGLAGAHDVVVRGDHFYVGFTSSAIARFDLTTGDYVDRFVAVGSGGLFDAQGFEWGPDGDLYVVSNNSSQILRYDGSTGDFMDEFVAPGVGGLDGPRDLTFGPDGNLYVSNSLTDEVLRYDGTTGAYLDSFVLAGLGGLDSPWYLNFAVVPEPSTALLLGVAGLLAFRRRRQAT